MGVANVRGGRRPKPAALKVNGGRKLGREPEFDVLFEAPEPPDTLGEHGAAEWRRIVPELVRERVLCGPDLPTVEAYCLAYQTVRECALQVKAEGLLVTDPVRKRQVPHPLIAVGRMAARELRAGAAELGLSPVTRSRLAQKLAVDDESDPLAEFAASRNEDSGADAWDAA